MNAQRKPFNPADLDQFHGTDHWYQHGLTPIKYTDGVRFLADGAGAFWLIDDICFAQKCRAVCAEEFQTWTLKVVDKTATLTCDDGNGRVVYSKRIEFTDFPMQEIKLWLTDQALLLPSEY